MSFSQTSCLFCLSCPSTLPTPLTLPYFFSKHSIVPEIIQTHTVWGFVFFFLAVLWVMEDLSSPTKDWICSRGMEACSLNHWTTREVPKYRFLISFPQRFLISVRTGSYSTLYSQHLKWCLVYDRSLLNIYWQFFKYFFNKWWNLPLFILIRVQLDIHTSRRYILRHLLEGIGLHRCGNQPINKSRIYRAGHQ